MSHSRRKFLSIAALTSGAMSLSGNLFAANSLTEEEYDVPSSIRDLKLMVDGIVPISVEERKQRIAKAQDLMSKEKIDAIFLEGTASSFYFTSMRW